MYFKLVIHLFITVYKFRSIIFVNVQAGKHFVLEFPKLDLF